jgi:hypothetical protein
MRILTSGLGASRLALIIMVQGGSKAAEGSRRYLVILVEIVLVIVESGG